jgi:hypothetical protein
MTTISCHIKSIKLYTLLSALMLLVWSCTKDEYRGQELNLNSSVKITVFTANSVNGVIDDKAGAIQIELPFGTDFTAVKPVIEIPSGATVEPASGASVNLRSAVKYRVLNGNIYSDYTVTATEKKAVLQFKAGGVVAEINEAARTITAIVPDAVDITKLAPEIKLETGAAISPATGTITDFTNPVVYTVKSGSATVAYTVTIQNQSSVAKVAFLGTYANRTSITNTDEATACNWLFANFPNVEYVSFDAIKNGTADLNNVKVIWWHEDATQSLPAIAYDAAVVSKLKNYRSNGGALLLTTYAGQYLEALGIVPAGKNPNNVFGDNTPWIENNWDWGMSFKGREDHPAFEGLTLTSDKPFATAYLLAKKTYRLNHCAWYKVNEWGGYGDAAGWRNQTGGIDLAGPEWNDARDAHIGMAEWQRTAANGPAIAILFGSYDWYTEPDPATGTPGNNMFKANVERLTKNTIKYLSK